MGVLQEQYQDSNVVADFFKTLKYIGKGGKPPESPSIELKDNRKVDQIKKLTNPSYQKADLALASTPNAQAIEGNKLNVNVIAKNVYDIFRSGVMSGRGGKVTTDIYNILSQNPRLLKQGGNNQQTFNSITIDKQIRESKISYKTVSDTIKAVISPAIRAGVLKWEEPREWSPKDIANKLVNKLAGTVKQTAGEVFGQDMIARM